MDDHTEITPQALYQAIAAEAADRDWRRLSKLEKENWRNYAVIVNCWMAKLATEMRRVALTQPTITWSRARYAEAGGFNCDLMASCQRAASPEPATNPELKRDEPTTAAAIAAKNLRPGTKDEPWVVWDDAGLRVTFSTEEAAHRWRAEFKDRLRNGRVTHEPPPSLEPERFDIESAKRLRRICELVGVENAIPHDDAELLGCLFSVLGMIVSALKERAALAEEAKRLILLVPDAGGLPNPVRALKLVIDVLTETQDKEQP